MNYQLLIVGGICLIIGFAMGILLANKKNDFLSALAEFIVFAKHQNKSDELINKTIKNLIDLMLKGYDNFINDPKAANNALKADKKHIKNQKALIKSMQKDIDRANAFLKKWELR
ncbi:MAG: hypothetical protein WCP92_02755 [bacterium]